MQMRKTNREKGYCGAIVVFVVVVFFFFLHQILQQLSSRFSQLLTFVGLLTA